MPDALITALLEPSGDEVEIAVGSEKCAGECGLPLGENGEEVCGLIGEDAEGLPGFALFHASCLSNRLLELL